MLFSVLGGSFLVLVKGSTGVLESLSEEKPMPKTVNPGVLKAVYAAMLKKLEAGNVPTHYLYRGQTIFRSINPNSEYTPLKKPKAGGHVRKADVDKLLIPGPDSLENRFTGPSHNEGIYSARGIYFVLQQQALINEMMYYSGKVGESALSGQCVLGVRVTSPELIADLSSHTPNVAAFLNDLKPGLTIAEMLDPDDYSVARGIGLAIAHSGVLKGLSAETARLSERSPEERGDNLVSFGLRGLEVEKVYFFFGKSAPDVFPVE